jgi:hypothetical protein
MAQTGSNQSNLNGSKSPVISVITFAAVLLLGLIVIGIIVAGFVFGIRLNEKLTSLETKQDNFLQNIAQFDEMNAGVEERLTALEMAQSKPKPQFSVSSFEIESSISEYDYIDDYITFEGFGFVVEETGSAANYLVILKQTLISGGSEWTEALTYKTLTVIDGVGEFSTYDSGLVTEVDEPRFTFEIIGYIELND